MSRAVRRDLVVEVATMYHKQGLNQGEIAARVKVSRQTVSRLLREALDRGIVTFEIHDPSGHASELAARLRERFHLDDATVVDGAGLDETRLLKETTQAAARDCYPRMAQSSIIGMLWGPTVLQFSADLPRAHHPRLTIAQMGGMIPTIPGRNAIDPAVTAVAEKLGATADLVAAPLFVDNPTIRDAIMSDSRIAAPLSTAKRADMYIFSVGKASIDGGLYQSGYVTTEEIANLEAEGAVGELCGLFYSLAGEPCGAELESRTIALGRDEIRAIPQRILIAAGEGKARAVAGALAGGYATEAYLDSILAAAVLDLTNPQSADHDALECPECGAALTLSDGGLHRALATAGE